MSDNQKLNHYLAAWNLPNPQLLTQTMTSHIYTVTHDTETAILKLLSPSETEEQRAQWHCAILMVVEWCVS